MDVYTIIKCGQYQRQKKQTKENSNLVQPTAFQTRSGLMFGCQQALVTVKFKRVTTVGDKGKDDEVVLANVKKSAHWLHLLSSFKGRKIRLLPQKNIISFTLSHPRS